MNERLMERRSFLALLAAAPIAALAPWTPARRYLPIGHPSCSCTFCVLHRQFVNGKMSEMGRFDWYMDPNIGDADRQRAFNQLNSARADTFTRP